MTERLCWCEKGSPSFARISHGNFTGTPGPLSYAEHHGAWWDKEKHRNGESERQAGEGGAWLSRMLAAPRQWVWNRTQQAWAWENWESKAFQSLGIYLEHDVTLFKSESFSLNCNIWAWPPRTRREEEGSGISHCSSYVSSRGHSICGDTVLNVPTTSLTSRLILQGQIQVLWGLNSKHSEYPFLKKK